MAKKKSMWDKWAFTAAWVISLVLAIAATVKFNLTGNYWLFILVLLGIVVGWMYKAKDVMPFLWLTLIFVLLSQFTPILSSGYYVGVLVGTFFDAFKIFLSTAAFIVVYKKIYSILS